MTANEQIYMYSIKIPSSEYNVSLIKNMLLKYSTVNITINMLLHINILL